MAELIRNKDDANGKPFLTFIVGATMNAPDDRPEACGHVSVYELAEPKRYLFTDFNSDVHDAMRQAHRMADRNGIQYIWVREFAENLPNNLWT